MTGETVQTLIHEWVGDRVVEVDPFDREEVIGGMIRDQYQGGSTIMTATSGVEAALWDIIGKGGDESAIQLQPKRAFLSGTDNLPLGDAIEVNVLTSAVGLARAPSI